MTGSKSNGRIIARVLAIGIVAACGWQAAGASSYSGIYVFGDSLSDAGNVYAATGAQAPITPPYFYGRFSNGPNYADVLAGKLGLAQNPIGLNPSLAPGPGVPFPYGSNYAWGGADSGPLVLPVGGLAVPPVYRATLPGAGELPSQLQLYGSYLQGAGTGADPNALYVLWTGGGDVRDAINWARTHPSSALVDGQAVVDAAIGNIQASLATLQAVGAQHVLVANVPDLGATPETQEWAVQAGLAWLPAYATTLSGVFDTRLDQLLGSYQGLNIIPFDAAALFDQITTHPSAYGITDTTHPCLSTGSDSIFIGGPVCANPNKMFFWDNHHPNATVHAVIGNAMFAAAVPEPATAALLLAGLAGLAGLGLRRLGGARRHAAAQGDPPRG